MSQNNFRLFAPDTGAGWRVISWTSFAMGERRVALGAWTRVYDTADRHIGYQPRNASTTDEWLPWSQTPASAGSISPRECRLNAGLNGRSRTARLGELDRVSRVDFYTRRPLAPEDEIERAIAKVRLFTVTANVADGGDRAVRVYPKG